MKRLSVAEIVRVYLEDNEFDGLYLGNEAQYCHCYKENLFRCRRDWLDEAKECRAGYIHRLPGGGCVIKPDKPKEGGITNDNI